MDYLLDNKNLVEVRYHAPRGQRRLYSLAENLSREYLFPNDVLVGVIGLEGAGKSTLIRGLFPGLELTNDDEGINHRTSPLFDFDEHDYFSGHTFHLDIRFESAFHQMHEIAEAIRKAINAGRRVVVEHFDLIYPYLGHNAQVIFAISEELRIYRPTIFGPTPKEIKKYVDENTKYRLMAHSAEDLTSYIMEHDFNCKPPELHSDIKHGFIIGFQEKPNIDLDLLEKRVREFIDRDEKIYPGEGNYVHMGDLKIYCTGKRIHAKSTGQIENFRLVKEFIVDPITKEFLLIGIAGPDQELEINSDATIAH